MADVRSGRLTFRDDVRRNPLWALVVVAGVMFVATSLAWVMAGLGLKAGEVRTEPVSPVQRFLNERGALMIAAEVAVILAAGLLAMVVDRVQTIREQRTESTAGPRRSLTDRSIPSRDLQ